MTRRRLFTTLLAMVAAFAMTSVASAYLGSTGSGSGTGSVSAPGKLYISAGGATSQKLLPTGTATGDVTVALDNETGSPVHVNRLVLDTAKGANGYSANAADCGVTYATQDNSGSGWHIAAGATRQISLPGSVTMATSAPHSCQGKTFTIYLKTA